MLAHHRKSVCLSLLSTDLPILASLESAATIYQKDRERFHLLLSQPFGAESTDDCHQSSRQQLLWLELSPYRVLMTMQENGRLGYRHFWEEGIYGSSRYWLHSYAEDSSSFRLRNFTRSLKLQGNPFPQNLRLDYELWSDQVQLGHYVLHLEIHQ
ncbi:MAG: hypothetical protein ACFB4I_10445 [Cyanophyceae cyanobacterium]